MVLQRSTFDNQGVGLSFADTGGSGVAVVILHGLAGSSREFEATAHALQSDFRVILLDQRGHGDSVRHPADASREAYVSDVVSLLRHVGVERAHLVGQSMGAHTALLVAATHPELVESLVMLEGNADGGSVAETHKLGDYLRSWPTPFADLDAAHDFLGDGPLAQAWIEDLRADEGGLHPRFDAEVMERTLVAMHRPRWKEWEGLRMPVLAVFADGGMFTEQQKASLIARRPETIRADIAGATHDAHLDSFETWIEVLRGFLDQL